MLNFENPMSSVHPHTSKNDRGSLDSQTRQVHAHDCRFKRCPSSTSVRNRHARPFFFPYSESESLERYRSVLEAEAATRQAELRYEELVDSLEGIVWRAEASTLKATYVAKQTESILGYPIDQWLREPHFWEAHLHPDDRLKSLASYRQAVHDLRRHALEYRMIAANSVEWSGSTTLCMPSRIMAHPRN